MADEQNQPAELKIDRGNLFKEETYTDLKVGMIKRMTPVKADGTVDKTRKSVFVGQTSLMTPNGPLPIQAVIQAKELQQAIKRFPEAMQASMQRLAEEAKKYQEEQEGQIEKPDSRIIIPGRYRRLLAHIKQRQRVRGIGGRHRRQELAALLEAAPQTLALNVDRMKGQHHPEGDDDRRHERHEAAFQAECHGPCP